MDNKGLIDAAKNSDLSTARSLIDSGADVNCVDEQGWTPLNFAAGKGDLPMVKLLAEKGADIFKVGRDNRTPYMIALAAGRVSVVKYLREAEDRYPGEKTPRPERKYCKAYHLKDLRQFSGWRENRIDGWKKDGNGGHAEETFPDDMIVFIHQDLMVTESMWHNENVIFNGGDSSWREFCADVLKFKTPDDLSLIVPNELTI
jgi:uncharacterized protein